MSWANMGQSFYVAIGKRCFDLVAASSGLILISPLLLLASLAVKLSSQGPVYFRQNRVGQFGRPFRMYKFRSMRQGRETGSKLTASGDPRITAVGSWLRRTKIDELPQLFNVLLGDMSLVGPRPEVPEFVAYYSEAQRAVLRVRPGITGPSVNIHEEELLARQTDKEKFYVTAVLPSKLAIDLSYASNVAFPSDMRVLLQTMARLLRRVYEVFINAPHTDGRSFETRTLKK